MIKKLSKYGNSLALIIDKPILELLNISESTALKITTDGKTITIAPADQSASMRVSDDKKVQKAFEDVMEKYAPALKKLAEAQSLETSPSAQVSKKFQKNVDDIMEKYADDLKKLAGN